MYIKNIELTNFRNYEHQKIEFINGINLFVGNNANGKTNIIESIYLSALGKSYRVVKDNEIVMFDKDYARINLNYSKFDVSKNIDVYIDSYGRKSLKQDGIKVKKLSDHVGELPIVIFSPDSLDIIKGAPSKRRNFIDMICSQLSKSYYINLQEYMKCLKLKNNLLKKDNSDRNYIRILNEKMATYIFNIVKYRNEVLKKILERAKIIQRNLTDSKENINIAYITEFLNISVEDIKKILDLHLDIEIMRRSSVKGIQRDDFTVCINDLEVSKYGSQGQSRTALLTLKLADFELLKDEKDDVPILLLDDIMSELDGNRIKFLLDYISKYQSIVTTTDAFFAKQAKNIKIYDVKNGKIN